MSIGKTIREALDVDLAGLSAAAAPWFARMPVSDNRIQSVPDGRTLRFYQSTGLLARPLRYDGRVARYGQRHLLQLLAVRALQSQGLSLAQVQTALSGANDAELAQKVDAALGVPRPFDVASASTLAQVSASASNIPTTLVAAELAPGVVVTIDSRFQTDAARVIELLRRAIQGADT